MVDDEIALKEPAISSPSDVAFGAPAEPTPEPEETEESVEPERSSVTYSCLRCNTPAPAEELDRLPEIKCICGFRVFIKNRPPVVKSITAL